MVLARYAGRVATGAQCDGETREIMEIFTREVGDRTFELAELQYGKPGTVEVREITYGRSTSLTRDIDLPYASDLTDEVLLAMADPRRLALAAVMQQYLIVSGPDYQYEDDYELLYSTTPVGRYVCVSGDETYHWIHVVETVEAGLRSLASDVEDQMRSEYPSHPDELRDLDTGESLAFRIRVVAELV
jgi:hypothetical protein